MKLIIGLGNIGKEYENSRHNIGFMCLHKFSVIHELVFKNKLYYSYALYKNSLLMLPKTYMNRSGEALMSAIQRHGKFDEILVILDDIELPIGKIRIRPSGGDGGHNGLKSILECAESQEIPRLRIGIGRPASESARDYVLDDFTSEELTVISKELDLVAGWLDIFVKFGLNRLLDEYSIWNKKPIPSPEDGINRPKEETNGKGL